ncbi:MAG: hypothetical protein E6R13_00650 [Spirochaetes bacterium]|nr:MAG: hypothetical protein E6R13_00650 [Spirochaetota bacterium]
MTEIVESNTENSLSNNLEQQKTESYFTQEQVNAIVRRAKEEEKKLAATQPEHFMEKYGLKNHYASNAGQAPNDLESLKKQVVDDVKRSFLQEQEEQRNYQLNQAVHSHLKDLASKLEASKDKYADYDSVVGSQLHNLKLYPNVATLANLSIDNPADVMVELLRDGVMLDSLERTSHTNFPLLERKIKEISEAVKQNQQLEKSKQHRPPLSQMRPSNNGPVLGQKKDIDFYKKYF